MNNKFSEFHNVNQLSKTLRFELIPIGKTSEQLKINNIIQNDKIRSSKFTIVKKYCDEYHKSFIERCLLNVDNEELSKNLTMYETLFNHNDKSSKDSKSFENIQDKLRKDIISVFTTNEDYKKLFDKNLISLLKEFYKNDSIKLDDIKEFDKFTTYFTGYNTNRKNMYSHEKKSTSIAYRLIDQNLPTYLSNIKNFEKIVEKIEDMRTIISKELNTELYFNNIEDYTNILSQSQIESYNLAISGKSEKDNKKIKGINEYVNEYNQNNPQDKKLPRLKILYKQILSDTNTSSFKFDIIENEEQLSDIVSTYSDQIKEFLQTSNISNTLKNINSFDLEKIFINNDSYISSVSKSIYNDIYYIKFLREKEYDTTKTDKQKSSAKYLENRDKELKKQNSLSIAYIETLIETYDTSENQNKISEYFSQEFDICKKQILDNITPSNIHEIKEFLDTVLSLQRLVKILIPKDNTLDIDTEFYQSLDYEILQDVIPLYNKVRNFATKKKYSIEKIKLNFDNVTLGAGWDVNKESDNTCIILQKDDNYYLGVMNKKHNKIFKDYPVDENNNYKKMEYKLLPGPNKMLPKTFFANSNIGFYAPSESLHKKYNEGLHTKGDNFDKKFLHELIDFFKVSISKHEDWGKYFDFNFSNTNGYEDISQFYREVEHQGYTVSFKDISTEYIDSLVNDGKLFLFQIYNKDFSPYSKGTPNLHTMYFKALFDEENLKDVVYKLNGNAEIFYRKQSINYSEDKLQTGHHHKELKNKFNYPIIKDRRFTVDKFFFHVPITLNFKATGNNTTINDKTKDMLKSNDDTYVIGIDRGERHLIYISVIDSKCNIVEQYSLNTITNEYKGNSHTTDYHQLLDKKEQGRDNARKNWETIENIKELKEGYMSQVVHKISQLVIKYNAVIALEDLNSGFKNSRIKVEKQVYQKFENMLINKLSYLVDKGIQNKRSAGGVLNAYQFANTNITGHHNGIIFYVPAWNTSKIDPTTGFVNLFTIKYTNIETSREFINKFDDIRFNKNEQYFEFDIDYEKFNSELNGKSYGKVRNWTICTYSDRIKTFRNPDKNNQYDSVQIDISSAFKELFDKYDISLNNIKDDMLNQSEADFFKEFTSLFKLTLQMRNSNATNDYIISPVKNTTSRFYDSRECNDKLPLDADANGAYNIARKGLMVVSQIKTDSKFGITNQQWLEFAQNIK